MSIDGMPRNPAEVQTPPEITILDTSKKKFFDAKGSEYHKRLLAEEQNISHAAPEDQDAFVPYFDALAKLCAVELLQDGAITETGLHKYVKEHIEEAWPGPGDAATALSQYSELIDTAIANSWSVMKAYNSGNLEVLVGGTTTPNAS